MNTITEKSPSKKYVARYQALAGIEADLRERIAQGVWAKGMMIPSRRELAREYAVDLNVIQRAVAALLEDETLVADGGRGTFVGRVSNEQFAPKPLLPADPLSPSAPTERSLQATIGVIGSLWGEDPRENQPQDNWPLAVLRAFEWAFAEYPNVTIRFRHSKAHRFSEATEQLIHEEVNAIALIWPLDDDLDQVLSLIDTNKTPVVVICDGASQSRQAPYVCYEHSYAGYQAGRHLVQRGYRNVSFFAPYEDCDWMRQRRDGVVDALRQAGARPIDREDRLPLNRPTASVVNQERSSYDMAAAYLRDPLSSWGIVAANDHAAYGLMQAAQEIGLMPGRDIGIIGFDDRSYSRALNLTSLHPPLDAMGSEGADLLVKFLQGNRATTEVRLRSYLVPRDSTQPAVNVLNDGALPGGFIK